MSSMIGHNKIPAIIMIEVEFEKAGKWVARIDFGVEEGQDPALVEDPKRIEAESSGELKATLQALGHMEGLVSTTSATNGLTLWFNPDHRDVRAYYDAGRAVYVIQAGYGDYPINGNPPEGIKIKEGCAKPAASTETSGLECIY